MMNILCNWRYYAMILFLAIAIIGLCSFPNTDNGWWAVFLIGKTAGAASAYVLHRCVRHWSSTGSIPEFDRQFNNIP